MQQKNFAVILLGANIGDKEAMFKLVKKHLTENVGDCIRESAIYSSKPWGFEAQDDFINQLLVVETEFSAVDTLLRCQAIEKKCRRERHEGAGYESRVIDIDLLYFNNDIIDSEQLTIPHPLLHKRRFALEPLCEIIPEYVHPILLKTNRQLLDECEDKGEVVRK